MNQDQLLEIVISTVNAWAQEEFDINDGEVSLAQRRKENLTSFTDLLLEKLAYMG